MSRTAIKLTDAEFKSLRDIIYKRSGIAFQESKRYVLESRLARRLDELEMDNFDQYIAYLTMGPYQMEEFQEMFNRITINETSFFRNEPQLNVFETQVLPELLEKRKGSRRLRIWSAACSSGEEPYTIAMQLHRTLGIRLADWNIEILGTDISEKVLGIAQGGRYTSFSFRSVNPLIQQKYFRPEGADWVIRDDIRQMVSFELHNLKDALAAKRRGVWDVIFCRNVLIYFDDGMKRQCAQTFHDCLADDGYLFIGHSETLRNLCVPLAQIPSPQAFAYQKSKGGGA
ncbi:MAG: CheR family methyltransferase [Phycisphaerales bacterium]